MSACGAASFIRVVSHFSWVEVSPSQCVTISMSSLSRAALAAWPTTVHAMSSKSHSLGSNQGTATMVLSEELEQMRRSTFAEITTGSSSRTIDGVAFSVNRTVSAAASAKKVVVAAAWTNYLDLGRTFAFSKQFEDRVRALTPEQVNAAFRKYVSADRLTFVVAGDAKKGIQ